MSIIIIKSITTKEEVKCYSFLYERNRNAVILFNAENGSEDCLNIDIEGLHELFDQPS
jgi:hypothetical protein